MLRKEGCGNGIFLKHLFVELHRHGEKKQGIYSGARKRCRTKYVNTQRPISAPALGMQLLFISNRAAPWLHHGCIWPIDAIRDTTGIFNDI